MAATASLGSLKAAAQYVGEPGDDELYEIIGGRRIDIPPASAYSATIASRVLLKAGAFVDERSLGEVVCEMLFRLPLEAGLERNRRPDVAFVSYDRWPPDRPQSVTDDAWDVVPDLAVEVTSPNDLANVQQQKISEYFRAGVRLVWAIFPERRIVHVYEALDIIRVVTEAGILDGGIVLPGFQLPLDRLFGPVVPANVDE
jgi:Uma2 family endonuclease